MMPFFPIHTIIRSSGGLPISTEPMTRKEKIVVGVVATLFFSIILYLFNQILYCRYVPGYRDTGTIVSYENSRMLFTKYVNANIRLSNGNIVQIKTGTKPQRCEYHDIGSTVRIEVMPMDHAFLDLTKYTYLFLDNPCY